MTSHSVDNPPSALLAFRATNVRSFKDPIELNLLSTTLAEKGIVRQVSWREGGQTIGVLPVVSVIGANASGKTNLLKAMNDMRRHVLTSFQAGSPSGGISRSPFLFDSDSHKTGSTFEIDIVLHGIRHEYGFTLDSESIIEEWAYRFPKGRRALIFHRTGNDVVFGSAERAKSLAMRVLLRPNALYLSTAARANHPLLLPLSTWFEENFLLAEASSLPHRHKRTIQLLNNEKTADRVRELIRAADLGLTGARTVDLDPTFKEKFRQVLHILNDEEGELDGEETPPFEGFDVRLVHQSGDHEMELDRDNESLGTMVWFGLIGLVIDVLSQGSVLLADELGSSLHPNLVKQLIRIFQDPKTNPHLAQLIFNSHDITHLGEPSNRLLGRDQIWFTEKNRDGSTRLWPLSDMDPRKEEAVGQRYLAGRYGATPILSDDEFNAVAELITANE